MFRVYYRRLEELARYLSLEALAASEQPLSTYPSVVTMTLLYPCTVFDNIANVTVACTISAWRAMRRSSRNSRTRDVYEI